MESFSNYLNQVGGKKTIIQKKFKKKNSKIKNKKKEVEIIYLILIETEDLGHHN